MFPSSNQSSTIPFSHTNTTTMATRLMMTILLLSLLSLFPTTTLAHNRFPPLPTSCIGNPTLLKCALDFEFALKAAAAGQIHISPATITVVLDSVNAAKAAGISIIRVLSTMDAAFIGVHPDVKLVNTLNSTISLAVSQLIKASAALHGETELSLRQLHSVGKTLKMASEVGAKLNACVGLKQAAATMNPKSNVLLSSLIKQFISLTNLSLKVIATVKAAGKISL